MADRDTLAAIKPTKKEIVFDLVQLAGFDVSDWIESSNDSRGHKANPKYCYEWSFVEPNQVAILSLWHDTMVLEQGQIVHRGNFRVDAESHRGKKGRGPWFRRATAIDEALQTAIHQNLPVKVIVNDGIRGGRDFENPQASDVTARQMDGELWSITEYDWNSGEHAITRGIFSGKFIDQFDIDQADKASSKRVDRNSSVFVHDPKVRAAVRIRANGKCEYCGEAGFQMESDAVYIETHHIEPLSEGGLDIVTNVIALCPNDHRKAHFHKNSMKMRNVMSKIMMEIARG